MAIECERKYLNVDFAQVRDRLKVVGAVCEGQHFESNTVWDLPDGSLRAAQKLLRLRKQCWDDGREVYRLTLKLKLQDGQGCKVRDERELSIADGAVMASVLEGLGYGILFRYEKVREVWHWQYAKEAVEIVLDTVPFAQVVEVEAPAACMEAIANALGLDAATPSTENYHALHSRWRAERHLPPQANFVFSPEEARRLCVWPVR
jgi:adenylate cyclase, class 2